MLHHHARFVAVAIAAVLFSTPTTAQQEPTSPTTLKTVVESLWGTLPGMVNSGGDGRLRSPVSNPEEAARLFMGAISPR